MFIIFRNVLKGAAADVNIGATIGTKIFAFMWIATACSIVGWLVQMGMCCCCASRRDVRRGVNGRGRRAYADGRGGNAMEEKPKVRRRWGRKGQ